MAKDLDFRTKQVQRPTQQPASDMFKALPPHKSKAWIWIVILVLIAVAAVFYWQFKNSASTSKTPVAVSSLDTQEASAPTPTSTNKIAATSSASVQVYDSGAGAEAVNEVVAKLKAVGYSAENLERSQFNYDQTYIWYRVGALPEAEKVKTILGERKVSLKETQISGSFDVLVLLGK